MFGSYCMFELLCTRNLGEIWRFREFSLYGWFAYGFAGLGVFA